MTPLTRNIIIIVIALLFTVVAALAGFVPAVAITLLYIAILKTVQLLIL